MNSLYAGFIFLIAELHLAELYLLMRLGLVLSFDSDGLGFIFPCRSSSLDSRADLHLLIAVPIYIF